MHYIESHDEAESWKRGRLFRCRLQRQKESKASEESSAPRDGTDLLEQKGLRDRGGESAALWTIVGKDGEETWLVNVTEMYPECPFGPSRPMNGVRGTGERIHSRRGFSEIKLASNISDTGLDASIFRTLSNALNCWQRDAVAIE